VIEEQSVMRALQALHQAFALDKSVI